MPVIRTAAFILAALLFGLALFQLALALGAPWGRAAFGGLTERPGTKLRVSAAVATVIWAAAALIVIRRVDLIGWGPLPTSWLPVALWVIAGVLALSIVVNALSPSVLEKAIWIPFGAVATALAVIVALGPKVLAWVEATQLS